jgi:hypothetical protein
MKFNTGTVLKIAVISALTTVALSHLAAARKGA